MSRQDKCLIVFFNISKTCDGRFYNIQHRQQLVINCTLIGYKKCSAVRRRDFSSKREKTQNTRFCITRRANEIWKQKFRQWEMSVVFCVLFYASITDPSSLNDVQKILRIKRALRKKCKIRVRWMPKICPREYLEFRKKYIFIML